MQGESSGPGVLPRSPTEPFSVCVTCISMYCLVSFLLVLFAFLVLTEHGYSTMGAATVWLGLSIAGILVILIALLLLSARYALLAALVGICFSGMGWNFLVAGFAALVLSASERVMMPATFFRIAAAVSVPFLILIDRLAAQAAWKNRVNSGTMSLEKYQYDHKVPPLQASRNRRHRWWQMGGTWGAAVGVVTALVFRRVLPEDATMAFFAAVAIGGYFLFMGIGWTYGFGLAIRAWAWERSEGKVIRIRRTKRSG